MVTPEDVRAQIQTNRDAAQGDPEAWHGSVDDLRTTALAAIAAGHPHATELASAVLEADSVPTAWWAAA